MTRHETIVAGRGARRRAVRVERRVGRSGNQGNQATANGKPRAISGSGVISPKPFARENLNVEKGLKPISIMKTGHGFAASKDVGKWDIGCRRRAATKPEIRADLSTAGLLADDVCRMIRPETGTFGRQLWGEML